MTHAFSVICPFCDYEADCASAVTEKDVSTEPYPENGDASLCIKCGQISVFDHDHARGLRRPTAQECKAMIDDPKIQHVRIAWQAVNAKRQ